MPCGCAQTSNPREYCAARDKMHLVYSLLTLTPEGNANLPPPPPPPPLQSGLLKILRWESRVLAPSLHQHTTYSLSKDVFYRNDKCPCLILEVCLHDLRSHMPFFEEGQSLITSNTSLPHNTQTHILIAEQPLSLGSIVRNGLCQSKECILPLEKGALHNHVLRMFQRKSVFDPRLSPCSSIIIIVSPLCISRGPSVIPE